MYENSIVSKAVAHQYETILSSPVQSSSPNNAQQASVYVPLESALSSSLPTLSKPSFQRRFPRRFIAILGLLELLSGLIGLVLELLIFDISMGLWCGIVYALAGAAILVLAIGTDRERHQTSAVLIFQFVALMFTITELMLLSDLYRKRCLTVANEPTRAMTFRCQSTIAQMAAAAVVLVSATTFSIIYFRVTMIVLKQPYGTCNMSNALNLSSC